MNHCILAIKDDNNFLCVLCIYEGQLSTRLERHYNSMAKALALVELGDINSISENEVNAFHRDWGISWRYTKPQYYSDKSSLLQYCEATGLDLLFLFEDNEWQKLQFDQDFEIENTFGEDDHFNHDGKFEIDSIPCFHRTATY